MTLVEETQPYLIAPNAGPWVLTRDGDPTARAIYRRHYSRKPPKPGVLPQLIAGPGEKMVLLTPCARALFVWRKFMSDQGQDGVNCAVFRNEGAGLSSELILAAMEWAWNRWPIDRLYTYVNPRKVRSTNPGYCFLQAGWRRCGVTKWNKLIVLEAIPSA